MLVCGEAVTERVLPVVVVRPPYCPPCARAHSNTVHTIAWDAQRSLIFAGAADHTVSVNDAVTGQVLHQLKVHANCISAVLYFPGGTQLIAFDFDGRATVYSHDFEVMRVQQVHASPVSCARGRFKDGCNRVVTGSWSSQVRSAVPSLTCATRFVAVYFLCDLPCPWLLALHCPTSRHKAGEHCFLHPLSFSPACRCCRLVAPAACVGRGSRG